MSALEILLVEDSDDDAELLTASLRHTGFKFERADRLSVALAALERRRFDVVLLDLTLPDSSGFETFQRLHQHAPQVATIVFTGLDDEALGLQTVQEGAQDFLVKGDAGTALLVRAIRYAFERKRAEELTTRVLEELRIKDLQMHDDLCLAREVQEGFLPQQYPKFPRTTRGGGSLRFAHRYTPAGLVGGDFFGVTRLSPELAGILICDVMGHGVRAALVTAMLRAMVGELPAVDFEPGELLEQLNQSLREILKSSETPMFVSAFYGVINSRTGELWFANAGHPSPLRVRADGKVEALMADDASTGRVLGLFDATTFTTGNLTLERGDRLLCFTDGIYEVDSASGETFGVERLRSTVATYGRLEADALLDEVIGEVQEFSTRTRLDDDVCLLAVDFLPEDAPDPQVPEAGR